jgi:bacillithiol system protein YtxJ
MAITWNKLERIEQIEQIKTDSQRVPCLILKHSTRCNISSIAKYRLEDDWDFEPEQVSAWYLDLLAYRPISNYLSEHFTVHHESPQILLISQGECIHDASHLDISVEEIKEVLPAVA